MSKLLPAPLVSGFVAILSVLVTLIHPAIAGPGHDHGPSESAVTGPSSPRVVATSEAYEFVGIKTGTSLTVYLDRLADTSPVSDASLEIIIDGTTLSAEPQPDGTYKIEAPVLADPGRYEVIVTITDGKKSDLLVGSLVLPEDAHKGFDHDHAEHHQDGAVGNKSLLSEPVAKPLEAIGVSPETIERKLSNTSVIAGLALAFGILISGLVGNRARIYIGVFGLLVTLGAGIAWAGPGHDHGENGASVVRGDAPRRLPDGELFLPKPTQRLLAIRTRILKPQTVRATDRLIGRIIPDPNRSGLVQSTIGGRIKPSDAGLPVLGQQVKAGDILAFVQPAFAPIDASDVRQTAGDLEQRIAVLDARIARQSRLVAKQIASRANLEDLQIERKGLIARRNQLNKSRNEPETLVSPVDGVIAEIRVASGQVVNSADTLFRVVDPAALWIEAISFDPAIDPSGGGAKAKMADGSNFDLTYVGRSRALQQQATVLQFRVDSPSDTLNIGSPVKVLLETGEPITGLIIPRSAVAQAPNGQLVTFRRLEPERYLPSAVRIEDLDGDRVHVTAGLKPGDQIIVKGAPLVNQIR
ncbi:MAG: efflux RND transporter periplasmic adaptor subunit [Filomicrobium sp.]